jgi:hypothetical protein
MFKKTLNFSELKSDPNSINEMKDSDVFQVFHRGQDVKVIMTQEHFLNLMARLEKAEGAGQRTAYNPKKLMAEFDNKIDKLKMKIM